MKRYLYLFVIMFFVACSQNQPKKVCEKAGGTLNLAIYENTFDNFIFPPDIESDLEKSLASISYVGLFHFNPYTLHVENAICTSWTLDSTECIYTFTLDSTVMFQKDVCFGKQQTRNVTAEDVRYTFSLLSTPEYGSKNFSNTVSHIKGAKEYYETQNQSSASIEGIEVLSTYSIRITLDKPFPNFIRNLASPVCAIIPKEAVLTYGNKSTVGVGPFRILPNEENYVFTREENFFIKDSLGYALPYLDTIRFYKVSSLEENINLFVDGTIDAMMLVSGTKINGIISLLPGKFDYVVETANVDNLFGDGPVYNIKRSYVKGLYTNNLSILGLWDVYIKH